MSQSDVKVQLEEWRTLMNHAKHPNVQRAIKLEIDNLTSLMETEQHTSTSTCTSPVQMDTSESQYPKQPTSMQDFVSLTTFAWDQDEKFVKLYLDIPGVHDVPDGEIIKDFQPRSFDLKVLGAGGKNYRIQSKKLFSDISPTESSVRVKRNAITIVLRKKGWMTWDQIDHKANKLTSSPSNPDSSDPNASIMGLMKNLYEQGDDEMKRTIAKAWTQSMDRQAAGHNPLDDMGMGQHNGMDSFGGI